MNDFLHSDFTALSRLRFAASILATTVALGCGPEAQVDERRTTVSGTVTFDGKPLPAGSITFTSTDSPLTSSATIEKGSYSAYLTPIGSNDVSIETESIQVVYPAGYVKIPEKYAFPTISGLTADIKPGENKDVNFDLKK